MKIGALGKSALDMDNKVKPIRWIIHIQTSVEIVCIKWREMIVGHDMEAARTMASHPNCLVIPKTTMHCKLGPDVGGETSDATQLPRRAPRWSAVVSSTRYVSLSKVGQSFIAFKQSRKT